MFEIFLLMIYFPLTSDVIYLYLKRANKHDFYITENVSPL